MLNAVNHLGIVWLQKKKKKQAKRSKCKMLVQIQAVRIYAIMCFNGKI